MLSRTETSAFRLEVRLDESRVAVLDRSKPVAVVIDSLGGDVAGASGQPATIAEVERSLDPGSHAFLVKIDLPPHAEIRSGMYGRARFAGSIRQAIVVPASAIIRRGQLTSLFVVGSDNRARLRLVQVGAPVDGRVSVTAGLEAGESVVVEPPISLVDGTPVRAAARSAGASGTLTGAVEVRR